jgi:hypothetical protein
MLLLAETGCAGVNLHTGGEAAYAAFVGEAKLTERPLFFGMQFAQRFAGATFVQSVLATRGRNVTAYAARRGGEVLVAILNKDSAPTEIRVTGFSDDPKRVKENWTLTAHGLEATNAQWQQTEPQDSLSELRIPQYSGRLVVVQST